MASEYEVLTLKELSEMLHIHPDTLYKLIRKGEIPGFRIGNEWRFRTDEAYLKNRMEVLRHLIHNQLIELAGDEARSRSYFDAVGPPTSSPSAAPGSRSMA